MDNKTINGNNSYYEDFFWGGEGCGNWLLLVDIFKCPVQ